MTKAWLVAVAMMFGLCGCVGLKQFPETSKDNNAALATLDKDYADALQEIYGLAGSDAPKAKSIRNRMIETRMAVIDAYFREFQAGLVQENVKLDFGTSVFGVVVGAAGSLVHETASQILSAVSGGLAGAQAAYGKSVLYDKAMSALLAQMHAARKTIQAQIYQRWGQDLDGYPMWMARTDLEAYYFAGSLPGAIIATAADAKTKEGQADTILLRAISPKSASSEMFVTRSVLGNTIDGLDATKAKALVAKIATGFPEIKPFVDAQYPSATQKADADGSKAKTVLKRAVVLTVRSPEDAGKWHSAIEGP